MIKDNKKIPQNLKAKIIENPHWILNDLEVLELLIASENKKNKGNVVDLRDIFLKKTKAELDNLSKIHNHTISAAYENFLGAQNLHRCIIKIMEQKNLNEFINVLNTDIKNILNCSEVLFLNSTRNIEIVNNPFFFQISNDEIQEISKSVKLTKKSPTKLHSNSEKLFINHFLKEKSPNVFSEAILSIGTNSNHYNKAILIFGSSNRNLFKETSKTDYFDVLAKVVSIQFEGHLMDCKNAK